MSCFKKFNVGNGRTIYRRYFRDENGNWHLAESPIYEEDDFDFMDINGVTHNTSDIYSFSVFSDNPNDLYLLLFGDDYNEDIYNGDKKGSTQVSKEDEPRVRDFLNRHICPCSR